MEHPPCVEPGPQAGEGARPPADREGPGAIEGGESRSSSRSTIVNVDRTTGAMLSGEIAKRYGEAGLPDDTIVVKLTGTAGQSFGGFLAKGVTLELEGDANDYVGKGLSGGHIVVRPPAKHQDRAGGQRSSSATRRSTARRRARAFFRGVAGERFGVRNSGSVSVVEGHRRPRLRVHDGRRGGGAGRDRAQLRRRHVGRRRLRLRRGRHVRGALQHGDGRADPGAGRDGGRVLRPGAGALSPTAGSRSSAISPSSMPRACASSSRST